MAIWPTKDNARGPATVWEGLAGQLRADQVRPAVMQPRGADSTAAHKRSLVCGRGPVVAQW